MKKTVVLYRSHYGATKQYAEFLARELDCDLLENRRLKAARLADYETIIFGGGLYAGGVSGLSFLKKNAAALAEKNLVVFTCGLADPQNPANVRSIRTRLECFFTPDIMQRLTVFHLRGGIDYARLGFLHRTMMGMMFRLLSKKPAAERTDEDREFLATYGKAVDFIDQTAIAPVAAYVRGL